MLNFADQFWKEVRCPKCRTLLCYEYIYSGRLMFKCHRCNEIFTINYKTPPGLIKKLITEETGSNPDDEIVLKRSSQQQKLSAPSSERQG